MMQNGVTVSEMDRLHFRLLRENVTALMQRIARDYGHDSNLKILDIAPQDHQGARPYFKGSVETFDINPASGCTHIGDICATNAGIPADTYDLVICTEVLEHTLQPFAAVAEMYRILKPGGLLVLSTPFNFRIHGPLPDCWRFTIHGLKALLRDFRDVAIDELRTPDRDLMPIHYTATAKKPEGAGA